MEGEAPFKYEEDFKLSKIHEKNLMFPVHKYLYFFSQLGCFKRKSPHQFEEEEPGQDGTSPVLIKKILSQSETEYKLECPPEEKSLLDDTKGDVPNDLE